MTILGIVYAVSAAGFLFLALVVGFSSGRRKAKRYFVGLCLVLAFFLFSSGMSVFAATVRSARLWFRLTAFSFTTFYPLHFHTAAIITGVYREMRKRRFAVPIGILLYLPAVVILVASFVTDTLFHIDTSPAGTVRFVTALDSPWFYLFVVYYWSCIVGSVVLFRRWRERTARIREKKEARILQRVLLVTLVVGSATDILVPIASGYTIRPIGPVVFSVYLVGLWFVFFRFQFPDGANRLAAESLVAQLQDGAMLLDDSLRILSVGRSFERVFGLPVCDIHDVRLSEVMRYDDFDGSESVLYGVVLRGDRRGGRVSLALTAITDEFGDRAGYYAVLNEESGLAILMQRYGLTGREVQIVQLCASGRGNSEICEDLGIARRTVETHLSHVYSKVGVHNRIELFRFLESMKKAE